MICIYFGDCTERVNKLCGKRRVFFAVTGRSTYISTLGVEKFDMWSVYTKINKWLLAAVFARVR